MQLQQFDIGTAFFNGDLHEEIFMDQPQGYVDPTSPNSICLLHRSLYGLRQSACQWNKKMDSFLQQWDLLVSDADSCVYRNKGDLHTMLGIYVDDGIIASMKPGYIEDILTYLESAFKVVRGGMEYFIGYQIDRDPSTSSIFIHQTQYINDILLRFGLQHAHSLTTPADKHAQLSNLDDPTNPLINVPYKDAIGCLMYAAMLT